MGTKYLTGDFIDSICEADGYDEMDVFLAVSCNKLPDDILGLGYPDREHYLDSMIMELFDYWEIHDPKELLSYLKEYFPWLDQEHVYVELISNYHEQIAGEYGSDPWSGNYLVGRISFHVEASIVINEDFDDYCQRISKPQAIDNISHSAAKEYYDDHHNDNGDSI